MSPAERRIGPHAMRLEPPDTILITLIGALSVEQTREIHAALDELSWVGPFYLLVDVVRLGRIAPDTRAASARWPHLGRIRAIVLVGAGFEQRVVVTLIAKAAGLLSKDFTAKTASFASADEARGWIAEQRRPS